MSILCRAAVIRRGADVPGGRIRLTKMITRWRKKIVFHADWTMTRDKTMEYEVKRERAYPSNNPYLICSL